MFKKQERQGIIVYLYYNRDARKLSKYGDVLYHSRKLHYQVLYVNKEEAEAVVEEISALKFVKAVTLSEFDNINQDFVGNLEHFWYNMDLKTKEYYKFSDNSVFFEFILN